LLRLLSPLQSSLVGQEIARNLLPQVSGFSAVMTWQGREELRAGLSVMSIYQKARPRLRSDL